MVRNEDDDDDGDHVIERWYSLQW